MTKWSKAVKLFLKDWETKKEVTGIILCGSYITGGHTKNSDVDIQIILKKGCKWRERGNKIIDGILIEYFANPPENTLRYFEEDEKRRKKSTAHMFATGKIILDKMGDAKRLKDIGKKSLKKKFDKSSKLEIELDKYSIFDMKDNLEEVYNRKTLDFNFVYYNFLKNILEIYSDYLRYTAIPSNKIFRFLTNRKDQEKYCIPDFPDQKFKNMFIGAMKETRREKMIENYKELSDYVQKKMGGFEIDGWKLRSPAKKKK